MPSYNSLFIAIVMATLWIVAPTSWAQNSELQKIQQQRQELSDEYDTLKSRLQRQRTDLEEAKQSLSKTKAEMTEVFARAKTDPTERNVRQATLISITHNRKLDRVERVENRVADTQQRLTGIEISQAKLTRNEASIKQKLAQQEKLRQQQKRQAELAANAKREASQKKNVTKPAAKPVVVSKPEPPKQPVKPARKAGWPSLKQPHSDDIRFAKAAINAAQKQLEKGDKALLPKVFIVAKQSFGSKRMSYIGDDLYSVTAPLNAGNQKVTLFKTDFWIDVPSDSHLQPHRIIYDTTSLSKPQLYIIKEEQLGGG
ncbi:MAG: hypothetical protein AseanaTS_09040 [Candidatus Pelagadaptatus aseana]|uniref:hypothetical protein n=1 Tax=Candidatus Pelagadaptatus aseana TaxID=3120508 RepID=UPI0039B1B7C7